MGNIRNIKTTHPKKQARRQRAADRFTINASTYSKSKAYAFSKETECRALGLSLALYLPA